MRGDLMSHANTHAVRGSACKKGPAGRACDVCAPLSPGDVWGWIEHAACCMSMLRVRLWLTSGCRWLWLWGGEWVHEHRTWVVCIRQWAEAKLGMRTTAWIRRPCAVCSVRRTFLCPCQARA